MKSLKKNLLNFGFASSSVKRRISFLKTNFKRGG